MGSSAAAGRRAYVGAAIRSSAVVVLVSLLGVLGCADHRMSLQKFLTLQEETQKAETTPTAPQEATAAVIDNRLRPYFAGPGDVLAVTLTGAEPTALLPPFQVRVNREGKVDLPIVGQVDISGMELNEIENALRAAYVPGVFRDTAVFVDLISEQPFEVLVVGAVTLPGLVPLRRTDRDMLHAIVAAGGVSELASGKATLKRVRHPGEEETIDLTDPEGLATALAMAPLERGDIINVHAATPNTIFIGGLVRMPRPQTYPQGVNMTVLQAIAAAAGLRTDVTPREATLVRRMPDGREVQVKLDLDRIATGKDPNIMLAPGDILWVPETLETRVEDFLNRNIFLRAGVSVNYTVSGIEFLNRQDQQAAFGGTSDVQQRFDPFGFLGRNTALQTIQQQIPPSP